MPELNPGEWNSFISRHYPDAHLLQTTAWGDFKAAFGWKAARVAVQSQTGLGPACGAQILFRRLPLGFSFAYIPKGPLVSKTLSDSTLQWPALLPEIDAVCRKNRAVFLIVEPDLWQHESLSGLPPDGFQPGSHAIQPPRTLVIDLNCNEERLLARMKQKTRYNIKLALKKGVVVQPSTNIDAFHNLMQITGGRDQFGVHSLKYYRRAYELFYPRGACELLMAEYQGEPLAGVMIFAHGRRAWYFYGASANAHRERMPSYLLQWEAIRWARSRGCIEYDLWGVPDEEEAALEEQFSQRKDGLWGVYRFKRGFGGRLARSAGPWDRVYNPFFYAIFRMFVTRSGL